MKNIKTLSLAIALAFGATTLSTPLLADEHKSNPEKNIMIGAGSGALMGTAVAGPVGGVIGGVIGIFIGNEANHDKAEKQMKITLSDYQRRIDDAEKLAWQSHQQYEDALAQLREAERQRALVSMQTPASKEFVPVELNIQFDTASADIPKHYRDNLSELAQQLNANNQMRVQLFGYADRRGDAQYNQTLSEQRANSVRDFLIEQGVASSQIDTDGYGEAQPVTETHSWQNDFYDRRVVMRLVREKSIQTAASSMD